MLGATPPTAGWYPDPQRRYEYRWFNGERWTGDVSVGGMRYVDPHSPGAGGPATPASGFAPIGGSAPALGELPLPAPAWAAAPGWAGGPLPPHRRPSRAAAVAAMVLGICAVAVAWLPFVFVLGGVAAILGVIFGVIGLKSAKVNAGHGRRQAITGLVLSPIALVLCVGGVAFTRWVVEQLDVGPYTLETGECAIDPDRSVATFEGTIRNDDDHTRDYLVEVQYRANGTVIATDDVTVYDVGPGSTRRWASASRVGLAGEAPRLILCLVDVSNPYAPS